MATPLPSKINPLNISRAKQLAEVVMQIVEIRLTLYNLVHQQFLVLGDGIM